MKKYKLNINFLSYWSIGTGREAGTYADSTTIKDYDGFPYVPGKAIKGIYKDAFRIALSNGWFNKIADDKQALENILFGVEGSSLENSLNTNELDTEGALKFSNAQIDADVKQKILEDDNCKKIQDEFFRVIQNTMINDNGVAKHQSLRSTEVCVPISLNAEVELDDKVLHLSVEKLITLSNLLNNVCALVSEIGNKRRRGFGLCKLIFKEQK